MPITDGKYKNPGWVNNQKPAINAAELNAISTTLENLDAGGSGVGRSMAGETVTLPDGATVTAGEGAEIFNNYGLHYRRNIASGDSSHSEGAQTVASGDYSHAEGAATTAQGVSSHAEGSATQALGRYSHAEGGRTIMSGYHNPVSASGDYAHAEGSSTIASGDCSHAEGELTTASGNWSHASGFLSTASGYYSFTHGNRALAKGESAYAFGWNVIANSCQFVIGNYNKESANTGQIENNSDRFIIGGTGYSTQGRMNCFRVTAGGSVFGVGSFNTSGADYAELFEWQDGNPEGEDRAGLFVTLDGERIRIAGPEDGYILGIVSAAPSVVGDVYDDQWQGMYIRDVFGRTVQEEQHFPARTEERLGPDGQTETVELTPACRALAPKLNPDYDSAIKYQPRTQRPEWDAVGLLGKLVAVDDGSCQVNGWATVGPGGRATASMERTKYRVMSRLDDRHIRVMIL